MTTPDDSGPDDAAPLGVPGSGRRRYAAAMARHADGRLPPEALEAWRTLAARDGDDPATLLGLQAARDPTPEAALDALRLDLVALLHRLAGPGVAEARALLAGVSGPAVPQGRPHPVVERWLPAALQALADPAVAASLAAAHLAWGTYAYADAAIGPRFPAAHAFAPLAGPGAPWAGEGAEAGLFLMAPRSFYRDHAHAAAELYVPLTGPHRWRFAPGAPLTAKPALSPVWNDPHAPHAVLTGRVPFLALYAWLSDPGAPAYVLAAPDWDRIEAASEETL